MAEAPVTPENQHIPNLEGALKQKILKDDKSIAFFGLNVARVKLWSDTVLFDDREIRFSPGYMSAGWGHNQSSRPVIAENDLGGTIDNYMHESRHGLHNLLCQTLFEGDTAQNNFDLFKSNVLGDTLFVQQIEKSGGSKLQERMLNAARIIASKAKPKAGEIHKIAWILGALTYQHAYYVDPGMCEAAASFGDKSITWAVGTYNRWFSTLLIPGEQYFEGYTNKKWQEKFRKADPTHKALLVKKSDYKRDEYFPEDL